MEIESPAEMVNKRLELQVSLGAKMFRAVGLPERHSEVDVIFSGS